jgi:hypothetical protein
MSTASDATASEIAAIRGMGLKWPPPSTARRPLGLGVPADDLAPERDIRNSAGAARARELVDRAIGAMEPGNRAAAATLENTFRTVEMALAITLDGDDKLHALIAKLRVEVAELRTAIAESRHAPAPRAKARAKA